MESGEGGSDTRGDGPLSLFFLLPILLYFLPLSLKLILLVLLPLLSLQLILLLTKYTYFIPSFLIFILPLTCIPKSTVLLNFLI